VNALATPAALYAHKAAEEAAAAAIKAAAAHPAADVTAIEAGIRASEREGTPS